MKIFLTGGTGFNDAPRLTSGVTYQDTIATGESRFYRVPQQWGQRFSYLITEVGPAQPPLGVVGSIVWVDLFNPVRADITGSVESTGSLWFTDEPDKPFSANSFEAISKIFRRVPSGSWARVAPVSCRDFRVFLTTVMQHPQAGPARQLTKLTS